MTVTTVRRAAALAIGMLALASARSLPDDDRGGPAVLVEDFEGGRGAIARLLSGDARLRIVDGEGQGESRGLRATYVGGAMGSERLVHVLPIGEAGREYSLNYDVKFDRDFQFVQGGKLHGLGPARIVAGGEPVHARGWSARVMWRAGGTPELYTYHQDQRDRYGDHGAVVRRFAFGLDRFHAVSLHVRVNDPASAANGFTRLYVDGDLVERHEGLRLRGVEGRDTLISRFLFSTFHGGNDPGWAPRARNGGYADVHAVFDNFAVYRGERIRGGPGL